MVGTAAEAPALATASLAPLEAAMPHGRRPAAAGDVRPAAAETPAERAARVAQLRQLVRTGRYVVQPESLIYAVLDWDPGRSAPRQAKEVTLANRQAYMREYMRKRRLAGALSKRSAAPWRLPRLGSGSSQRSGHRHGRGAGRRGRTRPPPHRAGASDAYPSARAP